MPIPTTRPVIGRDLDEIKQTFGLSTADACWLFGLSITKWTQVARQSTDTPVKDPTLALLCRFLDQHPELSVMPKLPDATEMFDLINKVAQTDQKRFSILFGSEASAAYRWRKNGARQSPTLLRLMYYMKMALQTRNKASKEELLTDWAKTVEQEGSARGVNNVFKVGQWVTKEERERLKAETTGAKRPKSKAKVMVAAPKRKRA